MPRKKSVDFRKATGALLLALLLLVDPSLRLLPPVAAQLTQQRTTSGAEDAGVLLELKAAADTSACTCGYVVCVNGDPCPLDTWTADTEPCGDDWNRWEGGWVGVKCDAYGGRATAPGEEGPQPPVLAP